MGKKTYMLLAPELKLVKIGCSDRPIARMRTLRTLNAAHTEPLLVTEVTESRLHRRFETTRKHGEWFEVTLDMCSYLEYLEESVAADRLRRLIESDC